MATKKRKRPNRGNKWRRTKYEPDYNGVNTEKVFADNWEDENIKRCGIGHGQGILQNLFIEYGSLYFPYATHVINRRERMIVATVIQWLGSNCGWCWLEKVLDECGYKLVRKEGKK